MSEAVTRASPSDQRLAWGQSMTADFPPLLFRQHLNEVPFPPLPGVLDAVELALEHPQRYPDSSHVALVRDLANRLQVDVANIVIGPGGTGLIQQLLLSAASPGDEIVFGWPSFEGYPLLTRHIGAVPVAVPLVDATQDLEAMAAAITPRTRVVFVCSPNNPTGTVVTRPVLRRFLARVPGDVLVVVDQAYIEFVDASQEHPPSTIFREHPNVVTLRTFSKAYGLASLRVGYLVAAPQVAKSIGELAIPFAVSTIAKVAAVASLQAEEALAERVDFIIAERERMRSELCGLGVITPPSQANFLWLPLGDEATSFATACQGRGVLVRGIPGQGVRVTIGFAEANDGVISVAAGFQHNFAADIPAAEHASTPRRVSR